MEVKILEKDGKIFKFSIKGEDYTIGNLLQEFILMDERVLGAGFTISHPLTKELVFTIFFKRKTSEKTARKIVLDNINKVVKYLDNLNKKVNEALGSDGNGS